MRRPGRRLRFGAAGLSLHGMCSLYIECVLSIQNVFSLYRMSIECALSVYRCHRGDALRIHLVRSLLQSFRRSAPQYICCVRTLYQVHLLCKDPISSTFQYVCQSSCGCLSRSHQVIRGFYHPPSFVHTHQVNKGDPYTCMYVHTFCVQTNPPITQGSPLVPTFKFFFLFFHIVKIYNTSTLTNDIIIGFKIICHRSI